MMEIKQFERMIRQSKLTLDETMIIHLRFIVFIHVQKEFGIRSQCDTLAFGRDEFNMMTEEEAQGHIHACEKRLLRAAMTKQGVLVYESETAKAPVATKPVVHFTNTAINYPAH